MNKSAHRTGTKVSAIARCESQVIYYCGRTGMVQGQHSKRAEVHEVTQASADNAYDRSDASQTYSDNDHKTGTVSGVTSASTASGWQRHSGSTVSTMCQISEREQCVVMSVTTADCTRETKVSTQSSGEFFFSAMMVPLLAGLGGTWLSYNAL